MYNKKSFLAIIPARGGSKRLPKKNVLKLKGKPLIGWSIEAGIQSKYVDSIVVSSDSDEILDIASQFDISLIKRPDSLAMDKSTTFDAIKHAIENYSRHEYIVLLQPTSPLRTSIHIDEAIELLEEKKADAIVSVVEMNHSPLWSNRLDCSLSMENFISNEVKNLRSQDLEKFYRLNGAIYIIKTDLLLKEETFLLEKNIFAYIMDQNSSIDIDEEIDYKLAELLI